MPPCHCGGLLSNFISECWKYLGGAQPCLQLSALLLQGGNLFVLRQQSIGMVGEIPSSLTGKCPLVLFHWAGSHQRRGIDLHKSEKKKYGMDESTAMLKCTLGRLAWPITWLSSLNIIRSHCGYRIDCCKLVIYQLETAVRSVFDTAQPEMNISSWRSSIQNIHWCYYCISICLSLLVDAKLNCLSLIKKQMFCSEESLCCRIKSSNFPRPSVSITMWQWGGEKALFLNLVHWCTQTTPHPGWSFNC